MSNQDYYVRSKSRIPFKLKCDSNLIDDGYNCVDNLTCKRGNPPICTGKVIIKKYDDRLVCDENEDKIDNLCYEKCNSGYTAEGTNCRKGFDSILNEKISNNKPMLQKYNWYIVAFLFLFFLYVFLKK
jgi:hypothetical protein